MGGSPGVRRSCWWISVAAGCLTVLAVALLLDGCGMSSPAVVSTASPPTTAVAGTTANGITAYLDIPYASTPGVDPILQSLDVYTPAGAAGATAGAGLPVIVMIHGGAWTYGDKANPGVADLKSQYFTGLGYILVSINYRLAPAVKYPVPVQDCAAAIAWVHDNIVAYGGDPDTLFVMGHSAGAQLAALVATDERYLEADGASLSVIKGVIVLDGAAYDMLLYENDVSVGAALRATYEKVFGTTEEEWRDYSPVYHVEAGKGIPPFLIFYTGTSAGSKVEAVELGEVLQKAGVSAEVVPATDKTHGGLNDDIGKPGDAPTEKITQFLKNLLSTAGTSGFFPDVAPSSRYYAAVTNLAGRGVISGYVDGTFGPDDPVLRQQFAKMIVLTAGYPVSEADVCPFDDVGESVSPSLYPDHYIAVAAAHGIVFGETPTLFAPFDSVSRLQVVTMVVRTVQDLAPGMLSSPPASFAGTAAWAADPTHGGNARLAEYHGLLAGLDLSALDPGAPMPRGEVAQVLYNLWVALTAPIATSGSPNTTSTIPTIRTVS